MKKETQNVKEIKTIDGTNYIILPDSRVARLLKPMTQNGTVFYNLIINGEYKRVSVDKLSETK